MKIDVFPSLVKGEIIPPPSKSIAQRAVACALMARGESILTSFPDSDDPLAALQVAQSLGAVVTRSGDRVSIRGGFPNNFQAGIRNPKGMLNCGESGLASRLFTPVSALYDAEFELEGHGSLVTRPFEQFESILPQLGVKCRTTDGHLPVFVKGPMRGGQVRLDGSISSQFLTGLLLALPRVQEDTLVEVTSPVSTPYIDMTISVARLFGVQISHTHYVNYTIRGGQSYHPVAMEIPADWSGASFLLVAAAVCADTYVDIGGLSAAIPQADMRMMDALKLAGVKVEKKSTVYRVYRSEIEPFEFDATQCPDLFPPLVALAAFARGVCAFRGVTRLHHKESNRAKVLQDEFGKANVRIVIRDDEMKVYPGFIRPAVINPHADHRIAMAAAILGMAGSRMTIRNAECVSKSYPGFFTDIESIGAKVIRK